MKNFNLFTKIAYKLHIAAKNGISPKEVWLGPKELKEYIEHRKCDGIWSNNTDGDILMGMYIHKMQEDGIRIGHTI